MSVAVLPILQENPNVITFKTRIRILNVGAEEKGITCETIRTDRILVIFRSGDRPLNPHATPNLCRNQLRTFSNASRCVYGRKISKTIENYRKIVKIDEIWHAEKIKFRTVKVADFLQTVSPRCRE